MHPALEPPPPRRWTGPAAAVAGSVAVTLATLPLDGMLDPANIVMLYLLATVGVALRWGRAPAALAAVLNVLAFDFFQVPPHLSFAVRDAQYLVTFGVMLAVGLLIGQLTGGLRQQARIAARREERAQSLFELARELSGALTAHDVSERGAAMLRAQFGGEALVLPAADGRLLLPQHAPAGFEPARAQALLAGDGHTGDTGAWHYLPLAAPQRVRGVLGLCPARPETLRSPEDRQHLETMARQIAIALERVHYVEVAQEALVDMESERLRNALLSAISHDIRTPLTALIGLAESLRQSQPALAGAQADTADAIAQQARSLAQLAHNLLDMARLQAGRTCLRSDWESLEEVVGAALRAASPPPGTVTVKLPADLPLVEFDAVLLERVLVNLVENAGKYGGPSIEIGAEAPAGWLRAWVRDHGPGLPPAWKGRVAFGLGMCPRGARAPAPPGAGLGLAIGKAVVEAHGGRIRAADAPGGGALFTFELPRRDPPPLPA